MSTEVLSARALAAARRYAAAMAALSAARKAERTTTNRCEYYQPSERADAVRGFPGALGVPTCRQNPHLPEALWCPACTDAPPVDMATLYREKRAALAQVLRIGRRL